MQIASGNKRHAAQPTIGRQVSSLQWDAVQYGHTHLELLPLKHLQPCHGNLECLPVVILQQVLDPAADKIEALGPARLQRPDAQSARV